jgi:hypothetical protein
VLAVLAKLGDSGRDKLTFCLFAFTGHRALKMYLACGQWIADFIGDNFRPHAEAAEALLAGESPGAQRAPARLAG